MTPVEKHFGRFGNRLFQSAYLYSQFKDGIIPDYYLQDPKYFDKYKEDIKQLFGGGIGYLPYIGVHVRRGDYVNNSFYVDLSKTDYYEQAMAIFPGKNFIVITDDPIFCKEKFKGDNIQVMEGGTELEDFNMLASCASIIMANSSFSWWAAYLCLNPSKTIVAPSVKNWHPDGVERTVCPNEWMRI